MAWKSVVWVSCLVPVLTGCGSLRHATSRVAGDSELSATRFEIARDQRRDARAAWQAVRDRNPGHPLSNEFRDGFLDGYAEYLERGAAAQPPAVPPVQYTASGPGGSVRDYYLGFQYAAEVAIASGRQPFDAPVVVTEPVGRAPAAPTVPYVSVSPGARSPAPSSKFVEVPPSNADRQPLAHVSDGSERPPLPKPELPVVRPLNPPLPSEASLKLSTVPALPNPDLLPAPVARRPEPAPALPTAPGTVPTVLDHLPPIPFQPPAPK